MKDAELRSNEKFSWNSKFEQE